MWPYLKYLSLGVLILQTTSLVMILRYSRTLSSKIGSTQYLSSTAVVVVEVVKVVTCCLIVFYQKSFSLCDCLQSLKVEIVGKPVETVKMLVPSGLYVIQNNLLYVALTNLDAATYQVTYQLKILTTAIFSVIVLNKKLETFQWIALILLVIGVSLVQLPSSSDRSQWTVSLSRSQLLGLAAVIAACFSSGFAGVYFEKILKNTQQSLWIRNIQLGVFGLLFGSLGVLINDYAQVREAGFFQGYNKFTWIVISLQAFGGILVAIVIKYADNILKSFAASLSIVLSVVFSYFVLNDINSSRFFLLGTAVVLGATLLYVVPRKKPNSNPSKA